MGKLSKEQAAQLEELTKLRDAPDEEDFEVEIGQGDNFARVPYSKGRSWLQKNFGIDLDPDPEAEAGEDEDKAEGKGDVKRFGRRIG